MLLHFRVELPEPPVMVFEERLQVRRSELVNAFNVTVPVKPFAGVTVRVEEPWSPVIIVTIGGLAEIVKSGAGVT